MRWKKLVQRLMEELEKVGSMVVDGKTAKELGRYLMETGKREKVVIGWDRRQKRSAVVFLDEEE
ncbi:MAG: hypothetical protein QW356_06080 [Candidatus Hadarchaeales archaeon]